MSSSYTVHVSNIAPQTTKEHLLDFFTFCGKISSIDYTESTHTAEVHFEKSSAASTALMLNGGVLDGAQIVVTSPSAHTDSTADDEHTPLDQSDKPRAGIAAEYLAKGYILSDSVLQRAIEMDQRQGISKRFLNYFHTLDTTVGERALGKEQTVSGKVQEALGQAAAKAKEVDERQGVSGKAWDYYTRALSSPFGLKVKDFYTKTSKQVFDIHEEAKRIAEGQKTSTASTSGSDYPHDEKVSTATGTIAPPLDPAVHSTAAPLTSGADELKPKTTEAPIVL